MRSSSHLQFNRQERNGVFFLLLLVVFLQLLHILVEKYPMQHNSGEGFVMDSVNQVQVDSLKKAFLQDATEKQYLFNPNFISDYKGYLLGMSPDEIDRLHTFRAKNAYVHSAEEFQQVTLVSDSLLLKIRPSFKFPDWNKKNGHAKLDKGNGNKKKRKRKRTDLNTATATDLRIVYGIGEVLSKRIIKFRDRLGGFMVDEQLYDVYGLEPQVVRMVLERFTVLKKPEIKKININSASVEELQKLIYLQKKVSMGIVNYRNDKKRINSLEELLDIEDFPKDRFDRIVLYLSL